MLLFAHTGITLAAGTVIAGIVNNRINKTAEKTSWFNSLSKYVDIRVLMVGSVLPDIIDKPVGQYFFVDTFHNGRIFSHTLLFLLLLSVIGVIIFKAFRQAWMLTLAAGTLAHLILDGMWGVPGTILWPLLGVKFSTIRFEGWPGYLYKLIVSDPVILVSEIIGLSILLWFGITVIIKKQFWQLLKYGKTI